MDIWCRFAHGQPLGPRHTCASSVRHGRVLSLINSVVQRSVLGQQLIKIPMKTIIVTIDVRYLQLAHESVSAGPLLTPPSDPLLRPSFVHIPSLDRHCLLVQNYELQHGKSRVAPNFDLPSDSSVESLFSHTLALSLQSTPGALGLINR
jgi:hypothetical protein